MIWKEVREAFLCIKLRFASKTILNINIVLVYKRSLNNFLWSTLFSRLNLFMLHFVVCCQCSKASLLYVCLIWTVMAPALSEPALSHQQLLLKTTRKIWSCGKVHSGEKWFGCPKIDLFSFAQLISHLPNQLIIDWLSKCTSYSTVLITSGDFNHFLWCA